MRPGIRLKKPVRGMVLQNGVFCYKITHGVTGANALDDHAHFWVDFGRSEMDDKIQPPGDSKNPGRSVAPVTPVGPVAPVAPAAVWILTTPVGLELI